LKEWRRLWSLHSRYKLPLLRPAASAWSATLRGAFMLVVWKWLRCVLLLHGKMAFAVIEVTDHLFIGLVTLAATPPARRWWGDTSPMPGRSEICTRYQTRGKCLTCLPSVSRYCVPLGPHGRAKSTLWAAFVAMVAVPDFVAVATFCAIGLLVVLNLLLRFPDYGAVIEQYNLF
jgi:hypothetical protein